MSTAPQRNTMAVGATRNFAVSFADKLDTGELLTGTPTIVDNSPSSPEVLTITNKAVSVAELTINGATVPIGEAVQFSLSGQASGVSYTIKITVSTDATPAQVLVDYVIFDTEE